MNCEPNTHTQTEARENEKRNQKGKQTFRKGPQRSVLKVNKKYANNKYRNEKKCTTTNNRNKKTRDHMAGGVNQNNEGKKQEENAIKRAFVIFLPHLFSTNKFPRL